MTKYSPDQAKALYEEIVASTDIVGHAACGNPIEESVFRFTERTLSVSDDCIAENSPDADTDDGPPRLRFHVASPWHALIHLFVNNRGWLEDKQGSIRTPLLYRGQRDSSWNMVPSLFRQDADQPREERRLLGFCSRARKTLSKDGAASILPTIGSTEALSDVALEATAQHYGIKTSLLDFTSDPAVAVWFACAGGSNGEIASVFALPMAMGALFDQGILLCHPLARRPYRQHGLFIRDTLNYLKRLLIEIRFPIDTRFRILRDRLPTDLLPEDEWWTAIVAASEDDSASPALPESLEPRNSSIEESLLHMLQMLMELTTFDVSSHTAFNREAITQIASANGQMVLACDKACRQVAAKHFRGTMGQLIVPRLLDHLKSAALR